MSARAGRGAARPAGQRRARCQPTRPPRHAPPRSLCSVLISRLLWRWNCVLLPLLTAPQVAYAAPLCRVVLTAPGVEAPLDRVYHWLNLAQ